MYASNLFIHFTTSLSLEKIEGWTPGGKVTFGLGDELLALFVYGPDIINLCGVTSRRKLFTLCAPKILEVTARVTSFSNLYNESYRGGGDVPVHGYRTKPYLVGYP